MRFTVLTLFPNMIRQGLSANILGRAEEWGFISFDIWNTRDYTTGRHGHVDDAPYGSDTGMLMQADPTLRCYRSTTADLLKAPRAIYVTSQGRQFTQADAKVFTAEETLLILCGRCEEVGERALEFLGAELYSIGDYVLIGEELPTMVMVDAISCMVPGVLSDQGSGEVGSFESNLLEYPQYTRPEVYEGPCVLPVPLSGDHKKVVQWRREQALFQTRERRPDLFAKMKLNKVDRKFLQAQAEWSADES